MKGRRRHPSRPRLGDPVLRDGQLYRLAALVVQPQRGFVLRPHHETDAGPHDVVIPLGQWGFTWNRSGERWEAAAA